MKKTNRKRTVSIVLTLCLMLGLIGQIVPAPSVHAGTEVTSTLETLTVTDFRYEATASTPLQEGTYTTDSGGPKNGAIYAGGNLGNTILDVDITFGGSGAYIRYGGCNTWQGLNLSANGENLEFSCVCDGNISTEQQEAWKRIITPAEAGTTLVGEKFNLKLSIEFPNDTDAKIGLWFNDRLYRNEYIIMEGMSSNTQGIKVAGGWNWFLGIHGSETAPVTLEKPGAPLGYTPVTLFDYGLDDGSITSSVQGYAEDIVSFDRTVIQAQLSSETQYAYVRFGNQDESGIELIWDASLNLLESDTSGSYHTLLLKTAMNNAPVKVFMYIDYVGTDGQDLQVKYYMNDAYVTTLLYAGRAASFGKYVTINPQGGAVSCRSVGERTVVEQQTASYDISKKPYLIAGNNVMINGVSRTVGEEIAIPGDYQWVSTGRKVYSRKIVLYKVGDVDLNGTAGEEADWTALKTIVENNGNADTEAAGKGADLNNDGKVDQADLTLAEKIQAGKRTLEEVTNEYYPPALSYDFLGGNEVMPVAGYFGPYRRLYAEGDSRNRDYLNDEIFQLVKDSGINLVTYTWRDWYESGTDIKDMLELAEKYQIGYFVNDARLNTSYNFESPDSSSVNTPLTAAQTAEKLGDYTQYQSVLGTHVFDEPVPDGWNYADTSKKLKYFQDIAKTLNTYVNTNGFMTMRPEDSTCFNGILGIGGTDYRTFWNTFIQKTDPQVLAFDDYPFNDKASEGVTNAEGYFKSLSIARKKALDNKLPFWATVQAGGQFEESSSVNENLIATEAETYWNVNTSLAYGAKGIVWFTLLENPGFATNNTDKSGLIRTDTTTGDTITTRFYTWAQNANKQIRAVDDVLMKASSKGVVAAGGTSAYAYKETKNVTDSAVIEPSATDHLQVVTAENTTYGALVGCFDYKDSEAYYVVNYDVTENASQNITLSFDDTWYYHIVADGVKTADLSGTSCTLNIPSGKAILVVLERPVEENADVFVDLTESPAGYTIPQAAEDITVNGTTTAAGTACKDAGDYVVRYLLDGKEHNINAVVYRKGDANMDGSVDVRDLVRMKKNCTELTLSDVCDSEGTPLIPDGSVPTGSAVEGTFAAVDTLDGKAVTLKVNFPHWDPGTYVRIGGKASNWYGLSIYHAVVTEGGVQKNALLFQWISSAGQTVAEIPIYDGEVYSNDTEGRLYLQDLKLRVEFHKVGADLAVNVYIDNKYAKTLTYVGQADSLGAGFLANSRYNPVTVAKVTEKQSLLKSMDMTGDGQVVAADIAALRRSLAAQ